MFHTFWDYYFSIRYVSSMYMHMLLVLSMYVLCSTPNNYQQGACISNFDSHSTRNTGRLQIPTHENKK